MERELLLKHNELLKKLSLLPRKIVQAHGTENVPEFVLHDLCNKNCFNLNKAAYFVDNPDFDWLKGVAGFSQAESFDDSNDIWSNRESFSQHMKDSSFNQQVRNLSLQSIKHGPSQVVDVVQKIALVLGLENPGYSSWSLKHDNHGLLVFEKPDQVFASEQDMENGLYLLGFCPVH